MVTEVGNIATQNGNQTFTCLEGVRSWACDHPTTTKILKITALILGIGLLASIPLALPLGMEIVVGLAIVGITALVASFILFACSPPATNRSDLWLQLEQQTQVQLQQLELLSADDLPHRFSNIRCPRNTAISVAGRYLHASKVGEGVARRSFIASQAPLAEDSEPFWKAIFESAPTLVALVDLTTLKDQTEGGVTQYYPDELNQTVKYGCMSISFLEVRGHTYTYQITNTETGAVKTIQRCHYADWKDFGVISVPALHELVQEVETLSPDPKDLLWIHCRAGVGRTGSLITALILKEKIARGEITRANLDTSLVDLITTLRKQRGPAFVQQKGQLDLLHQYAESLLYS